MKRLARALFVAGSTGALVGTAQDARAAKQAQGKGGLQLSILTPDPSNIGDQVSLDVVCKGALVETVELYVDNALVAKRQVSSTQSRNILSFKLDTMLMSAGEHDVIVKAYSPDGKSTSGSARLRIPNLDLDAPVRISYPQNGMQVNGVVPVKLSLDSELARSRPYVTFFVDKEFKVLRNTPPYEFEWDTSKVANGWHLVEAWSQDADAPTPTKARAINVNVNNGGGQTELQKGIKDLGLKAPIVLASEKTKPVPAVAPTTSLQSDNLSAPNASVKENVVKPLVSKPDDAVRANEPSSVSASKTSVAAPNLSSNSAVARSLAPRVTPTASGGAIKQPASRIARNTIGPSRLPGIDNTGLAVPDINAVKALGNGDTYTARPSVNRISTKEKPTHVKANRFAVAFDGTQIAFDVPPRIESGVKLAPFRQIFEHTGGKLYWFGGTAQTVRAVNNTREIEIKIGDKNAKVNNQTLEMERKPTLDSGRTIVPLTFIRDALDVKINYDEKTGRLLIESKK